MRRFCIHRGSATTPKKFKNRESLPRYTKWSWENHSWPDQPPWKPSQHGKGRPGRAGGGVQGSVVALGSHMQQDKGGWVHPSVLLGFLGMALWRNLHLPRAFPELSSLTRFLGQFCVLLSLPAEVSPPQVALPALCHLCPFHEILTGNPDPKSTRLPLPGTWSFQLPPHGQYLVYTFGIMRHRRWRGTLSMDNGSGSGRSFPAWEHHYPGIRVDRCDGISG